MSKYQFTDDMAEISGFGDAYEEACRSMIVAGLEWFDQHPKADPKFQGYKDVFGFLTDSNADAKALSKAVVAACDDCTGAMHQAAIGVILWIKKNGWDTYCNVSKQQRLKR